MKTGTNMRFKVFVVVKKLAELLKRRFRAKRYDVGRHRNGNILSPAFYGRKN